MPPQPTVVTRRPNAHKQMNKLDTLLEHLVSQKLIQSSDKYRYQHRPMYHQPENHPQTQHYPTPTYRKPRHDRLQRMQYPCSTFGRVCAAFLNLVRQCDIVATHVGRWAIMCNPVNQQQGCLTDPTVPQNWQDKDKMNSNNSNR
jgi:hypothetical protein